MNFLGPQPPNRAPALPPKSAAHLPMGAVPTAVVSSSTTTTTQPSNGLLLPSSASATLPMNSTVAAVAAGNRTLAGSAGAPGPAQELAKWQLSPIVPVGRAGLSNGCGNGPARDCDSPTVSGIYDVVNH